MDVDPSTKAPSTSGGLAGRPVPPAGGGAGLGFLAGDPLHLLGPVPSRPRSGGRGQATRRDDGGDCLAAPSLNAACNQAARHAQELLQTVGASTLPVPLDRVALHLGIAVDEARLTRDVTALLLLHEGDLRVRLNSGHSRFRRRFALARAIGHLVRYLEPLGRPDAAVLIGNLVPVVVLPRMPVVDQDDSTTALTRAARELETWRAMFRDLWRVEVTAHSSPSLTSVANAFAAELVMPRSAVLEALGRRIDDPAPDLFDDATLKREARRFEVAPTAFAMRALALGMTESRWPLDEAAWGPWARAAGWESPVTPTRGERPPRRPPTAK